MLILECLNRLKNRCCWFLLFEFFIIFFFVFTHSLSIYTCFWFYVLFSFQSSYPLLCFSDCLGFSVRYCLRKRGFTVFIHPQQQRYCFIAKCRVEWGCAMNLKYLDINFRIKKKTEKDLCLWSMKINFVLQKRSSLEDLLFSRSGKIIKKPFITQWDLDTKLFKCLSTSRWCCRVGRDKVCF